MLAYLIAFPAYLSLRRRFGDPIVTPLRWAVIASRGHRSRTRLQTSLLARRPPTHLAESAQSRLPHRRQNHRRRLAFGLVSVELASDTSDSAQSTGDLYAIPLALGIAIGRIGCFLTGLSDNTYGTPTTLLWAINFGDNIPRHPTQLYEIAFLLALIPILSVVLSKVSPQNRNVILSGAGTQRSEVAAQSKDPVPPDAVTLVAGNRYRKVSHFEGAGANATASRETCFSSRHREIRVGNPATPSNSSWSPTYPSACSATSSSPTPASSSASEEFSGPAS